MDNQRQASPLLSSTQPTITGDSGIMEGNTARRLRFEGYVNDYRDGKKTRGQAYASVLGELTRGPALSSEEKEATFQLYSTEIDFVEARARFQLLSSARASTGLRPNAEMSNIRASDNEALTPKRPLSHISDGSGSKPEGGEPRKKKQLRESDMPWYKLVGFDDLGLNPSCIKSVELLRIFHRDIKKAKFYVSIAPAPQNIPPSQWERILKGESVDLDQIMSAPYRVTVVEERKATRKVSTSFDWSTAWRRAARAVAFAFPHRTKELKDYTEYIENEFEAKNPSGHHRIILYDIAIRNLVRGGQQVLLTDTHCFVSLYSAHCLTGFTV